MNYEEVQCVCGGIAYLDSYEEANETWYYYECDKCGRTNRLHYNYVKDAYDAWKTGDIILYDNANFWWNVRN